MAYRDLPTAPKTLVMRPRTLSSAVLLAPLGAVFACLGLAMSVGGLATLDQGTSGVVFAIFGIPFALGGSFVLRHVVQGLRTVLRFELDDATLTIDWCRGGRLLKSEQVPRDEVVDVAVTMQLSDEGSELYRVVVGVKGRNIHLEETMEGAPAIGTYAKQRDKLCAFLGVEARK